MPLTFDVRAVRGSSSSPRSSLWLAAVGAEGRGAFHLAGFFDPVQSLQPHYARTLDLWAEALEAHRDEATGSQSEEVYERYMKYLDRMRKRFRVGSDRRGSVHTAKVTTVCRQVDSFVTRGGGRVMVWRSQQDQSHTRGVVRRRTRRVVRTDG